MLSIVMRPKGLAYEADFHSLYLDFYLTKNSKSELAVVTLKSVNKKWGYLREAFYLSLCSV